MAQLRITPIPVPTPNPVEDQFQLTLNAQEMVFLGMIMGAVGGSPDISLRRIADSITNAIPRYVLRPTADDDYLDLYKHRDPEYAGSAFHFKDDSLTDPEFVSVVERVRNLRIP
jgi:hypothetical protein